MTTIRCWIYTDEKRSNKVLISDLSEEERKELTIALNEQAMEQAGYIRTA